MTEPARSKWDRFSGGWMYGCVNEWTDICMNGWMSACYGEGIKGRSSSWMIGWVPAPVRASVLPQCVHSATEVRLSSARLGMSQYIDLLHSLLTHWVCAANFLLTSCFSKNFCQFRVDGRVDDSYFVHKHANVAYLPRVQSKKYLSTSPTLYFHPQSSRKLWMLNEAAIKFIL